MLSEEQRDLIQEMFNIGAGHAAATLNDFVQQRVGLQVPEVHLCRNGEEAIAWMEQALREHDLAIVQMGFSGDMEGSAALAFSRRSAQLLASMLGDGGAEEEAELDTIGESVLIEVGNVLMNGVMGTLANMLQVEVRYQVPQFFHQDMESVLGEKDAAFLVARTRLTLARSEMEGLIIVMFALHSHDAFLKAVDARLEEMA